MKRFEIYGFAFQKSNISSITLYQLKNIDCCYLVWGTSSIETYLDFLLQHQPAHILGLGAYTGKDQDKIRIEQTCTNKFRNGFIEGNSLETIQINPYLKSNPTSKFAKGIGNSYCNYISYRITKLIETGELKSRYTFLHLPKSFNLYLAVQSIDQMI